MASPPGAVKTPLPPSFIQRAAAALRYAFSGQAPSWFGPAIPLPPVAPPDEPKGRQFDYPFSANVAYRPRSEAGEQGIDFVTLRRMAEPTDGGWDLLRLAIETRKDQMAAQRWLVRPKKKGGDENRAEVLTLTLEQPDQEHDFSSWQRMILEDLFVLDAPCVYKRLVGKGAFIPEVVDGATIKRLITEDGRTPLTPDPAYQQVIKGLPAFDYTTDELVYMPRNPRSHRIYGLGPVEQVILTVQTGLNRALSQLLHFTAGSVPQSLISTPDNWTPSQIADYQKWIDAYLKGDLEARAGMIAVPGGSKPTTTKDSPVKDEFDEWLARIVCYAFSLSPTAFVKQNNRATAQTSKEAAQEEGLEPLKLWWRTFMNRVLVQVYGAPDMEFAYEDEEIADPLVKAQVAQIAAGSKPWRTPDEIREDYGLDPLSEEQRAELAPPVPVVAEPKDGEKPPVKDGPPPKNGEDTGKLAKAIAEELGRQRLFVARTMKRT